MKIKNQQGYSDIYEVIVLTVFIAVLFIVGTFVWQQIEYARKVDKVVHDILVTVQEGAKELVADEDSEWQTYTNNKYSYAISYKDTWSVTDADKYESINYKVFKMSHHNASYGGFTVAVLGNSSNLSLDDFLANLHDASSGPAEKFITSDNISINGVQGVRGVVTGSGSFKADITYIPNGDYIYEIRYGLNDPSGELDLEKEKLEFEKILQTFKFIDPAVGIPFGMGSGCINNLDCSCPNPDGGGYLPGICCVGDWLKYDTRCSDIEHMTCARCE